MVRTQRLTTATALSGLMLAAGLSHAADNAAIIYAAENALYGAGYEIGQADGWMDRQLRSAIREFQSGHEDLTANGTLDTRTLEALGIHYSPAMAISENHLGSAKAARLALKLPAANTPPPKPVAAAEPVANPRPQPEPQALPEPAAKEETPAAPVVAQTEPANAPAPKVAKAEPAEMEKQTPQPEQQEVRIIAKAEDDPASQLPAEPTSAGPAEPIKTQAASATAPSTADAPAPVAVAPRDRSSGFLASLFDFLFGWLI